MSNESNENNNLDQNNYSERFKQVIFGEIAAIRKDVGENPRIRARAQERVYKLLDEAAEILDKKPSYRSLNLASIKVKLARQRFREADNQKSWLAIVIAIWMIAALGIAVFYILTMKLCPGTKDLPLDMVLMGTVFWGAGGAAIDGLRELHTRFARQELDPNRILWYIAHPLIGAGLGAIVFLLVLTGLLSTGQTEVLPGGTDGGFNASIALLLAALVGFEEESVIMYLRDTVRTIFRVKESSPVEGG